MQVQGGVGGAPAIILVGTEVAYVPFHEGFFYIDTSDLWIPIPVLLDGEPAEPGAGSRDVLFPNVSGLIGTSLFLQAAILDQGAEHGVALTNGLKFRVRSDF